MDQEDLPPIYIPEEVTIAGDTAAEKAVFMYIPELDIELKQILAGKPKGFTYRWAYHPGRQLHVLLVFWPRSGAAGVQAGVGIPAGVGDRLLEYMRGTTNIYLTVVKVHGSGDGTVSKGEIQDIKNGITVALPGVRFNGRRD